MISLDIGGGIILQGMTGQELDPDTLPADIVTAQLSKYRPSISATN